MPQGVALYALTYKDRAEWGPSISFYIAYVEFIVMPHLAYDL